MAGFEVTPSVGPSVRIRSRLTWRDPLCALPPPATFSFGPLDYQLTLSRDGDAVLATRSVRLRPGTIEPALYADWIRVLAAIDQREEQRLEILGKAPAPK